MSDASVDVIAIVRAGALGDVALALPAIAALRALYSRSRIRAIGYPGTWRVAGALVDEIVSIDSPAGSVPLSGRTRPPWLEDVNLAIIWSAAPIGEGLSASGITLIHATPYPPPGVHAATWLLHSLAPAGVKGDLREIDLGVSADELRVAQRILTSCGLTHPILLHPGSGATWKCWPAARFASVIAVLAGDGHQIGLLQGPADGAAVGAVQSHFEEPIPVLRCEGPRELAAVLSLCRLYIGNDSGVTHLAALAGASVIALFGPTDPASWSPLGDTQVVLRTCSRAGPPGGIRACFDT
ncbi:MAG: glycosyltransferase family 9 protein, partial [Chloroflexota bacterium]